MLTSLLLACSLFAELPLPHDPGLSSVHVRRAPQELHVHAAFANADFAAVAATVDHDRDGAIAADELVRAAPVLRRLAATSFVLAGAPAPAVELLDARLAENRDVELTLRFAGIGDGAATLQLPVLQHLARGHRCYIAVVDSAGAVQADALLQPTNATFAVPADDVPATGFGQAGTFFVLGIEHILIGFDHLAFLLALFAAGITWRSAVATITAFTVAHSLTLLAAATGLVGLPAGLVEAGIAASIVVVAVANLRHRGATHRWPLAFAFGLVHGFGFANVLAELRVGDDTLLPLLTFNLGVEVGQLAFAIAALPLLAFAARTLPRWRVLDCVSVLVGLAGVLWLVERVA
jgi:hydrogenase/urease accessory protein HupE